LNEIPFDNGAKILDIGCGPGTWIMVKYIKTTPEAIAELKIPRYRM
jgi:cyclopropane fatty-acyl-phospholipid synthase-like methyltransferase